MRKGEEGQIFGVVGKELFLVETQTKQRGYVSQKLFREMRLKRKNLVKSNLTVFKRHIENIKDVNELKQRVLEMDELLEPIQTTSNVNIDGKYGYAYIIKPQCTTKF